MPATTTSLLGTKTESGSTGPTNAPEAIPVDLVVECRRTHRTVMDMCKAKLHHVLAAAGLPHSQASYQHSASPDIAASAMAKQQAMLDADNKMQLNLANASKQRMESFEKKVDALTQARPAQSNKDWSSNKNKGRGKGKNKGGQPKGKGKKNKIYTYIYIYI